jgi:peptide/nickel transport system substrate-binding protein
MPEDRSSIAFNLDPRASFSDGRPLTATDVRFTFEMLKKHGKPFYRTSFGQVKAVEIETPHRIRFDLTGLRRPGAAAHHRADADLRRPCNGPGALRADNPDAANRLRTLRHERGEAGRAGRAHEAQGFLGEDLPVLRGLFNFDEIRYDFYRDANSLFEASRRDFTTCASKATRPGGPRATIFRR